jgi:predicted transcriptional regulator
MKTAISIPDDILEEAEKIAKEQHFSRSALFTIAVKEYLDRMKSQRLLEALNKAYSGPELPEDTALRQRGKKYYARKISKEHY